MSNEEAKQYYLKMDVAQASSVFFELEGPSRRCKLFSDLWGAVGLQFRNNAARRVEEVFTFMGEPDLAIGNLTEGMVGWLLHSAWSDGSKFDWILGYDIEAGVIEGLSGSSTEPDCSPANRLPSFDSEVFMESQQTPAGDSL